MIPGLPLIGNSLNLLYDPVKYLVELYQQHGAVFQIKMGFQNYTVMAGLEANKFLAKEGERVFSSESLFGGFARAMNTDVLLTVLDGAPHRHMRRMMQAGFSRSAGLAHLDTMIQVVQEATTTWQPGDELPVFATFRHLVVDQLGLVTTGVKPGEYFDDILLYLNTLLNVEALKVWPQLMEYRPAFLRAKKRIFALGEQVLAYHRAHPPTEGGRRRDLIDDILEGNRPDGQSFTEADLIAMTVGPFFAGMDTIASTISFYLYAVLKDAQLLARVQAEVDAVFSKGTPTAKDFQAMPVLHAAAIETLRRYPATPFTPRTVIAPFEFGGYDFAPGTEVMIAQTVTHFLPEYYPDPFEFNVERYLGEKSGRIPQVFTPYTLGAHTCLGAGLAEVQMMVTMAALLYYTRLELTEPDKDITVHTMPLPNPGQKFSVRVLDVMQ
jgi:cytochrome P450